MKAAVLCEFSGVVRDAFIRAGHEAISCDLLPSESDYGPHIQGDCREHDWSGYDLAICHPPCTYLTYAGTAHWNKPGRAERRSEAMDFFMWCWNVPAAMVCVENPFGLPCQEFRQPSQVINPFDFGESVRKRTCLWLKNLPILTRGDELWARNQSPVAPPEPIYVHARKESGKPKARYETDGAGGSGRRRRWHWTESVSPTKDRARERSRTFLSIGAAMAEQWGTLTPGV